MSDECLAFDSEAIEKLLKTAQEDGRDCKRLLGARRRNPYRSAADAFDNGWNQEALEMDRAAQRRRRVLRAAQAQRKARQEGEVAGV